MLLLCGDPLRCAKGTKKGVLLTCQPRASSDRFKAIVSGVLDRKKQDFATCVSLSSVLPFCSCCGSCYFLYFHIVVSDLPIFHTFPATYLLDCTRPTPLPSYTLHHSSYFYFFPLCSHPVSLCETLCCLCYSSHNALMSVREYMLSDLSNAMP